MSKLYPPFKTLMEELLQNCEARGATYVMTSGYRSFSEQDKLYEQGRTKPGLKITNARGGESAHNYGVAADFVAKPGGKVSWDVGSYAILMEEAEKLGLESGGRWTKFKDLPHVQMRLLRHALTFSRLKELHTSSGLPGVWGELDKLDW
jgi:peptidoglycan L-alanyl-D-glutamate endopeptidase CwlK